MVGIINSKAKAKLKDNEKEKISSEEIGNKDICEVDTGANGKQSFKKRKCSSEKLFVTDENDIKVRKKKKEVTDQNIDQQDERGKVLKTEDKDNTCDNEISAADNNGRLSSKKRKYSLEKVADESDIKIKKRRKESADQIIIDEQNEKEKMPKGVSEDKDNTYDKEINIIDNNDRQNLKKKKLVKNERDVKAIGNNIENQETSNKNRNKITEKKKRKLTIDDTIIADDSEEVEKKESQKLTTNLNKNKTAESECDENNETNALLETEKHSTRDFDMKNSDIEETSFDERKKKKNRKKRSKVQSNDICSKIGLQVMAKSDWKRLRNRYLDLQRHKMSQLKLHLRKAEVERDGIMTKNGWYHDKSGQNMSHDKSKHENDNGKLNEEEKSYGRVNYVPGIIVKIDMDEPCTDLQSFKVN